MYENYVLNLAMQCQMISFICRYTCIRLLLYVYDLMIVICVYVCILIYICRLRGM